MKVDPLMVYDLRLQGRSQREIAACFNVTPQAISLALKKFPPTGIDLRTKTIDIDFARELYDNGLTQREIADACDVSVTIINRLFNQHNITRPLQPHGTRVRYNAGCRCQVCRDAQAAAMRAYNARRRLDDPVSLAEKWRETNRRQHKRLKAGIPAKTRPEPTGILIPPINRHADRVRYATAYLTEHTRAGAVEQARQQIAASFARPTSHLRSEQDMRNACRQVIRLARALTPTTHGGDQP